MLFKNKRNEYIKSFLTLSIAREISCPRQFLIPSMSTPAMYFKCTPVCTSTKTSHAFLALSEYEHLKVWWILRLCTGEWNEILPLGDLWALQVCVCLAHLCSMLSPQCPGVLCSSMLSESQGSPLTAGLKRAWHSSFTEIWSKGITEAWGTPDAV